MPIFDNLMDDLKKKHKEVEDDVEENEDGDEEYTQCRVVTKRDPLNIRKGPGTKYDVLGSVPKGKLVNLLEETNDDWWYIEYKGVEGYCSTEYLEYVEDDDEEEDENYSASNSDDDEEEETEYVQCQVVTKRDPLNIREEPDKDSRVLGQVPKGEYVNLLEETDDDWWYIEYDGIEGYCAAQYLEVVDENAAC